MNIEQLRITLGSENWLRAHEGEIKKLLPATWTHAENLAQDKSIVRIAYGLKLLGIDWRTFDEFDSVMRYLEKLGILQRQNGYQVRANPSSIFSH